MLLVRSRVLMVGALPVTEMETLLPTVIDEDELPLKSRTPPLTVAELPVLLPVVMPLLP